MTWSDVSLVQGCAGLCRAVQALPVCTCKTLRPMTEMASYTPEQLADLWQPNARVAPSVCPSCLKTVIIRKDGSHSSACWAGRGTVYALYRARVPQGTLLFSAPREELLSAIRASPIPGPVPGDVPPVEPEGPPKGPVLRRAMWLQLAGDPRRDFPWRHASIARMVPLLRTRPPGPGEACAEPGICTKPAKISPTTS